MAEDRDLTHDGITGPGSRSAADLDNAAAAAIPGVPGAYPDSEAEYWQANYAADPYYVGGRLFEDYRPAYELGWASYATYGGEFDAADRVLANDWEVRKGVSSLSWDEARPASRAAWQRAHNGREYTTDGSASAGTVIETLNDLVETAKNGELGFREAAQHAKSPALIALFGRRAQSCLQAVTELQEHIQRLGGKPDVGGTVTGAAHRLWVHIRGLFGGASDETMLVECERGEDAAVARYRSALKQNLPPDIHAMVQRQFEGAQRNHDMIKSLRDRAHALNQAKTDDSA
jgi:uncharacterized protein (TIGR02284 family)